VSNFSYRNTELIYRQQRKDVDFSKGGRQAPALGLRAGSAAFLM
jgi:hypothetical protein